MSDYDLSIHRNPDAAAWAKFFVETTKDMERDAFRDEEYMIGWFANAMMAMHDHLRPDLAPVVLDDGSAFFVAEVPSQEPRTMRDERDPFGPPVGKEQI